MVSGVSVIIGGIFGFKNICFGLGIDYGVII